MKKKHHNYKFNGNKNKRHNNQKKVILMPKSPKNSDNEEKEEQEYEEFTIKLSMLYFDQCDPKKCTGKKMERLGLLQEIKFYPNYGGILLTPNGKKICSIEDHDIIKNKGICVIDCSWAKFNELNLNLSKIETRALPFMVAVNPVNFGKPFKLTCAEAFAACLFLGGFEKEAKFIMNHFKWGENFFNINQELFDKYKNVSSQEELKHIQDKYINDELENKKKRKLSDGLGELEKEIREEEEREKEENGYEEDEKIDMNIFKNINVDELTDQLTKHDI